MTRPNGFGTWLALVALLALRGAAPLTAGLQAPSSAQAAAAAKASPELIGALSKEIGATPEQAAGAAGALFGVAKSRLKADEFSQVANAVPCMAALLGTARAWEACWPAH